MVGNGCEIDAQIEHQNAVRQTECRLGIAREKALKLRCLRMLK